ncbi:MAG: hypothetical protein K2X28_01185 [Alphaproteobacteria bacterium]|nr:hypothetical protein [Alphaproteobacteria bacterium]
MSTLKPIVFGTLVLAALSVTQMDAFARGREGPRPHFEHQEVPHTINNPGAHPSGTPSGTTTPQVSRHRGPEVVTPGGVISEEVVVPEGGTTVTGQKDQAKPRVSCYDNPGQPGCK